MLSKLIRISSPCDHEIQSFDQKKGKGKRMLLKKKSQEAVYSNIFRSNFA